MLKPDPFSHRIFTFHRPSPVRGLAPPPQVLDSEMRPDPGAVVVQVTSEIIDNGEPKALQFRAVVMDEQTVTIASCREQLRETLPRPSLVEVPDLPQPSFKPIRERQARGDHDPGH